MWWPGKKLNLRDLSIYKLKMVIETHILPYFGNLDIGAIDDMIIVNFINAEMESGNRITGKGLCKNSVIKEIGVIKEIFKYATLKGVIEKDPTVLIKKMKKEPTKEYEVYTCDEVEKLIKVARPKWLGDMILLAYNTGMRKCECFGLQWGDIDYVNKSLMVVRSVTAAKPGDRFITEPKTRTSKRIILLDEKTIEMLKARHKKRTSNIWVFADKYGELLSPWYNVKYFRAACQKAEIPIRRFYDLRHTHITEMVEAGIALPIIQKRAGHSNINMTMHYTHIQPNAQDSIINVLNQRAKGELL